jgi:NAD(P)-dependent dehydrogenase (short-subunit alcohol dehydrogenase family)
LSSSSRSPGSRAALVTGSSTGIGRATSLRLDAAGWSVFAGVRRDEDARDLAAAGSGRLRPLILDVTDEATIAAARELIDAEAPAGLNALVNNAGVAFTGPVEFVPLDEFRNQLEINLVGHLAVMQATIPALRRARGRIVNVTSIGGVVATPFFGPYSASKFGLEAISDALRNELRPWGIETIAIEPGSVATEIWESGANQFERTRERMPAEALSLYAKALEAMSAASTEMGARGIPPDDAAALIEKALTARRPKARYRLGRDAHVMFALKRLLPDRAFDRVIARAMRIP